jgi:ABC-type uncharacterized transport system permease subunit
MAQITSIAMVGWVSAQWPLTGLSDAMGAFALLVVLNFLILGRQRPKLLSLGVVLLPLATGLLGTSMLVPSHPVNALSGVADPLFFPLHTALTFLGLTGLAVAFGLGVVYLSVRRRLKAKQLEGITELPALEVLDRIHFRFQLGGFIALSFGIVFGALWANARLDADWVKDPKILASGLIWLWYAVAIQSRLALGWRGRAGVWFSVVGFVGVVASLLGVTLLFSGWHGVGGLG